MRGPAIALRFGRDDGIQGRVRGWADWKKLAHSGHLGADLAGIVFEGLVATLVLFYLRHRSPPSSAP